MSISTAWRGAISLLLLAAAPGCGMASETLPTYRYRLTVEVDTPEGLRSGSSVIEVRSVRTGPNAIPLPNAVGVSAKGEAVAVDLPGGKTLYAVLRSRNSADWAHWIMFWMTPIPRQSSDHVADRFKAMLEDRRPKMVSADFPAGAGPGPYDMDARPMLVRFDDPDDPKSLKLVQPDDLAKDFGPGHRLRRITVQLTDDAVTTGIVKRLPWLPQQRGSLVPATIDSPEDVRKVSVVYGHHFYRGTTRE